MAAPFLIKRNNMKRLNQYNAIRLFVIAATLVFAASCDDGNDRFGDWETESSTAENVNKNDASVNENLARLEFPKVKGGSGNIIVTHSVDKYGITYSLEWDCNKKSQRWSCFQMHSGYPDNNVGRTVDTQQTGYPQDPDIPTEYRFSTDPFWGTGYDHGHICASEDRQYDKLANTQTFYLSNMQPQRNVFNAGIWLDMERQLQQRWNRSGFRDVLYVVKGGTIDNASQILGYTNTGLLIPKYFFMAILCKQNNKYKALAFLVEHKSVDQPRDLAQYVVSIDYLEQMTGIDFFCNLPDDIEKEVESASKSQILKDWNL